jgi:four helix bundle protein
MAFNKFEDIISWQKGQDLAVFTYENFRNLKDFSFRDQICRASVSVSNNIAEGFERNTDKDFTRFLYISLGSCSEVKSMLYLAFRLGYIDEINKANGIEQCSEIGKIINGLIRKLNNQ